MEANYLIPTGTERVVVRRQIRPDQRRTGHVTYSSYPAPTQKPRSCACDGVTDNVSAECLGVMCRRKALAAWADLEVQAIMERKGGTHASALANLLYVLRVAEAGVCYRARNGEFRKVPNRYFRGFNE